MPGKPKNNIQITISYQNSVQLSRLEVVLGLLGASPEARHLEEPTASKLPHEPPGRIKQIARPLPGLGERTWEP